MAKSGRPRKEIPWDRVVNYCKIHCTKAEIVQLLGISEDTLERACKREHKTTFAAYYELHTTHGKASLRRWQWTSASRGSVTMQQWLGKHWLGQSAEDDVKKDSDEELYERPDTMKIRPEDVAAAKVELEKRRAFALKHNAHSQNLELGADDSADSSDPKSGPERSPGEPT